MGFSYRPLFILLAKNGIKKTDLKEKIGLSSTTLAKLGKNEYISGEILEKLCSFFNCQPGEVMEFDAHTAGSINEIVADTAESYARSMLSTDIPYHGGLLHMYKTARGILLSYSYDRYYNDEEIPFYIMVMLKGNKDGKTLPVKIAHKQIQDKEENRLVMFSDDMDFNLGQGFTYTITEIINEQKQDSRNFRRG